LEISRLAAAAAEKVLGQNKQQAAAQAAQQAAQDPVVQMQQKELQIKEMDAQTKQKKIAVDAAAKADQLEIERERIAAQERIAGLQVGAKIASEKARLSAQELRDGLEMGIDIAREQKNDELARQQQPQRKEGE